MTEAVPGANANPYSDFENLDLARRKATFLALAKEDQSKMAAHYAQKGWNDLQIAKHVGLPTLDQVRELVSFHAIQSKKSEEAVKPEAPVKPEEPAPPEEAIEVEAPVEEEPVITAPIVDKETDKTFEGTRGFWAKDPRAWALVGLGIQRNLTNVRMAELLMEEGYTPAYNVSAIEPMALYANVMRSVGNDPKTQMARVKEKIQSLLGRPFTPDEWKEVRERVVATEKEGGINAWINSPRALMIIYTAIEKGEGFTNIEKVLTEEGFTQIRDFVSRTRTKASKNGTESFFRRVVLKQEIGDSRGNIQDHKEAILAFIRARLNELDESLTGEELQEIQQLVDAIPPKVNGPAKGTPKPPKTPKPDEEEPPVIPPPSEKKGPKKQEAVKPQGAPQGRLEKLREFAAAALRPRSENRPVVPQRPPQPAPIIEKQQAPSKEGQWNEDPYAWGIIAAALEAGLQVSMIGKLLTDLEYRDTRGDPLTAQLFTNSVIGHRTNVGMFGYVDEDMNKRKIMLSRAQDRSQNFLSKNPEKAAAIEQLIKERVEFLASRGIQLRPMPKG